MLGRQEMRAFAVVSVSESDFIGPYTVVVSTDELMHQRVISALAIEHTMV